ncbi:MAG: hypothetical protein AAF551_15685, partial [Bacteroidota bacterium]
MFVLLEKKSLIAFKRKVFSLFAAIFFILILAACDTDSKKTVTFGDNARTETLSGNLNLEELRDLAKPPEFGNGPQASGINTQSSGFKQLKTQTLFDEELRDEDDRFARLENAVQDIRNEFDKMSPAIDRLVSIESDLKDLYEQLSVLLTQGALDEPVPTVEPAERPQPIVEEAAPKPAPQKAQPAPTPVASNPGQPQIRVADHANKTRIVLQTPTRQNFNINFDRDNQLITIENIGVFSQSQIQSIKRNSKRVSDVTVN